MEAAVVALVILARLIVPLFIIRWPLPAIVSCMLLDAVDQTVFQTVVPDADLSGYQSYDKALDNYYLAIAYISTLRNWTNGFAVSVGRFLFYYRLVGATLFELTGVRELLLIFPNTFEYVFIFYEAVRLRWDPRRMSDKLILGVTAFIWIFIKLPQEWWIHVAQLDTTDLLKEQVFGVSVDASWTDAFANRPWVVVVALIAVVIAAAAVWWAFKHVLPPADRPITIAADAEPGRAVPPDRLERVRERLRTHVVARELGEKVVLVGLICLIFAQMLGIDASPAAFLVGVAIVVLANTALSQALRRREYRSDSVVIQLVVTLGLNLAIFLGLVVAAGFVGITVPTDRMGTFLVLMSLLITLYDRYRPEYLARFPHATP